MEKLMGPTFTIVEELMEKLFRSTEDRKKTKIKKSYGLFLLFLFW